MNENTNIGTDRACRPTLSEPNIALNLEICDLVNSKAGALPREACLATVKLINSRDPQVSELAVTLLDYLVKNCGYPVHLQISRKEFLNELVKRFPERPPPAYSRNQRQILAIISEWTHTICKTSRHKDDLTFIRDMYRLLRSKGYDFPSVKKEDAAVLNPSDNIKSIEELQNEDKIAQSAKLHELIRRGRPQDLKEANDLMKIMSGFKEDEAIEETKQLVHDDLKKLERKINILDDMLNNATNQGSIDKNDDTLNELISTVKVSQPRLQTIIQEAEGSDITYLLSINDKINAILTKIGHFQQNFAPGTSNQGINTGVAVNLLDFDDDPAPPAQGVPAASTNDALADLLGDLGGLSVNDKSANDNFGSGAINLFATPEPQSSNMDILSGFTTPVVTQSVAVASSTQNTSNSALDPFGFDFNNVAPKPVSLPLIKTNYLTINYILQQSDPLKLEFTFDNNTMKQLNHVQFSLAVTKAFELTLQSPSNTSLAPAAKGGIKQIASVKSRKNESFNTVKFKYKLDYSVDGQKMEENGVASITC